MIAVDCRYCDYTHSHSCGGHDADRTGNGCLPGVLREKAIAYINNNLVTPGHNR